MGLGKVHVKLLEIVFWWKFTVVVSDFRTKKNSGSSYRCPKPLTYVRQ